MRIGSLFSGIGGLELGLERAGCGNVVWQCEADPFARRVLAKHWPSVPIYEDVRYLGAWVPVPDVDIICGGFPCQDISNAGRGDGLDGARSGLFFELARVVRLVRPRYIVLENVSAILTRGGARILGEVASLGYDARWDCIPAAAVGAPHRRDRWFCVAWLADADRDRHRRAEQQSFAPGGDRSPLRPARRASTAAAIAEVRSNCWWPTQSRVGGTPDGLPAGVDGPRVTWSTPTTNDHKNAGYQGSRGGNWWPTLSGAAGSAPMPAQQHRPIAAWEGDTPRTVDPSTVQNRRNRLRALGNAVVPQVAEVVGRVLMQIHAERV